MTAGQDQGTSSQLQAMQTQEASIAKQLSVAEARLKSYAQEYGKMSSTDRELNLLIHQNRQTQVVDLRGQLDAIRQNIADVKAGVSSRSDQAIVRVTDGPLIVQDAPVTVSTVEAPHFFGMEPRQFREPALFILALPLMLALSRWIWRRTPSRANKEGALEGNPQITRLELAVESIAIEVERIGEAQRFTAKLLAERPVEARPESVSQPPRSRRPIITPLP